MRRAKRIAIGLGICLVVQFGVAGGLVAFSRPKPPQPLHSVTDAFARMDLSGQPAVQRYRARDGAELSYRTYAGSGNRVVVLIHGSAGSSNDMHPLATALQAEGATVLVPDLRGHGANYPHGDVAYVGQLDDDLADLMAVAKAQYQGRRWTLLGFSSGGGFALRIAGEPQAREFNSFVLLSPFLRYDAPTARPPTEKSSRWYSVAIPRIVGLSMLNLYGIHRLDSLPVLSFPVPSNIEATTATYSFRMEKNFAPHDDYRADIRNSTGPMQVLVGGSDELFLPDKFAGVFSAERKHVPVTIVPGMGHSDMITKPVAIQAAVEAVMQGK